MRAKKVTLLLFLTVISLLTIFLVVLFDDTVLAAENPNHQLLINLNLSGMPLGGMVVFNFPQQGAPLFMGKLKIMEVV